MSKRTGAVAGVLLSAVVGAPGVFAQTPKNPISTKPEGPAPNCTYTGSAINGQPPSGSNACTPGAVPGTDPNLVLPKNAAQQFPFPGDAPAIAPAAPTPQNPATPAVQGAQAPAPSGNATQRFPFPGETTPDDSVDGTSGSPAPGAGQSGAGQSGSTPPPPLRDAGSSGSSSSSSSSSSQADPGYSSSGAGPDLPDDNPNAPMPTPHHNPHGKKLPVPDRVLTTDEKEAEDVQVAGFYQNDGNYKAAYDRAKEAVGLQADDPDAHLALAEAARKLGKLDEAMSNYKKTLALDPVPKTRKVAEKALKEMSGS